MELQLKVYLADMRSCQVPQSENISRTFSYFSVSGIPREVNLLCANTAVAINVPSVLKSTNHRRLSIQRVQHFSLGDTLMIVPPITEEVFLTRKLFHL